MPEAVVEQTAPVETSVEPTTQAPSPSPSPTAGAATEEQRSPTAGGLEVPDVEAKWRDDWKQQLAANNAEKAKWINRYGSLDALVDAGWNAQNKIRSGALKTTLPEGADEHAVAEYRKAWGIPDNPADYGVQIPQGVELSENETQSLNNFLADLHSVHASPQVVHKAMESYWKMRDNEEQALYNHAHEATINQRSEIKAEYGRDFERNVRLAQAELVGALGHEKATELVGMTLADGTKLGDNPDFVRAMVSTAFKNADDAALVTSEMNLGGGMSIQDAYNEALELRFTDSTRYHSESHQQKLGKLASAVQQQRTRAA